MPLTDVRFQLGGAVASLGLPIAYSPGEANPPCVLIGPIVEDEAEGCCSHTASVPVQLIGRAPGDARSLDPLANLLPLLLRSINIVGEAAGPVTLGSTDVGKGELPAYAVTASVLWKDDDAD